MPKIKSHSGLKKRIKVTGSGSLQKRHAAFSHLRSKDRKIRKYAKKKNSYLSSGDRKKIKRLVSV